MAGLANANAFDVAKRFVSLGLEEVHVTHALARDISKPDLFRFALLRARLRPVPVALASNACIWTASSCVHNILLLSAALAPDDSFKHGC